MMKSYLTQICLAGALLLPARDSAAQGVVLDWAVPVTGTGIEQGRGIVTDAEGNVYTIGNFNDVADMDPGAAQHLFTSFGFHDVYVLKLDRDGNFLWARQIAGPDNKFIHSIDLDAAGNVYVVGDFVGTVNFNPGGAAYMLTAVGTREAFISKFTGGGQFVWARQLGGSTANSIAADGDRALYITGSFSGTGDFDPGAGNAWLSAQAGNSDVFITRLDTAGRYVWAVAVGGPDYEYGAGIAVDPAGYIYATGSFSTTADFDPGSGTQNLVTNGWGTSPYLLKLDTAGNYVWARGFEAEEEARGLSVSVDTSGNPVFVGTFMMEMNCNPGGTPHILASVDDGEDVFVAKFDRQGTLAWVAPLGGEGDDVSFSIATDRAGNVYTSGHFSGTADFDPDPAATAELVSRDWSQDIFVSKLDPEGKFVWVKHMSGKGPENAHAVSVDRSGNVYTTGSFADTVDFDPGPDPFELVGEDAFRADAFVHKMICTDTSSASVNITSCYMYEIGGSVFTESGTYLVKLTNRAGCDSNLTVILNIPALNPEIGAAENTLYATAGFETYQWLRDGIVEPGATDSAYTITENGKYQLAVTNADGCTDTSEIYEVLNLSISGTPVADASVEVYPNPVSDRFFIKAPESYSAVLTRIDGSVVPMPEAGNGAFSVKGLVPGVYVLQVYDRDGVSLKTVRLVKY